MPKFKKKPVIVEAEEWHYFKNLIKDVRPYWRFNKDAPVDCKYCGFTMKVHGWIDTLEGGHIVCPGDWIITGIIGEHYPCKPDIFKQTYEPQTEIATQEFKNPIPTVDIIIRRELIKKDGIVLIYRKNDPIAWALPGGFVDYGETLEEAAKREALEETGLDVGLIRQFHCYSEPIRDKRQHILSIVFIAQASGIPVAGDDAVDIGVFTKEDLPDNIAFDHRQIIDDYFNKRY